MLQTDPQTSNLEFQERKEDGEIQILRWELLSAVRTITVAGIAALGAAVVFECF